MLVPANIDDYRRLAEKRLPRMFFDYVDGGAYSETTLAANRAAFEAITLRQRVMRDVSTLDPATTIMGKPASMPLVLAPVGMAGMMARRGEVQAARAAEKAGIPYTLSTVGICPLEEVAAAVKNPFWFQLYMMRDRGVVKALLERAQAAGCGALVFTVDLPVLGRRYRDIRNGMGGHLSPWGKLRFAADFARRWRWLMDVPLKGRPITFGNIASVLEGKGFADLMVWTNTQLDPSVTWKDIAWVRSVWKGPLILKGILDAEDAREAVANGTDGIVVSNHGGRQLDSAPASLAMLPSIVTAVGGKTEILMDGGVRSGQDIAKAVALGAKACMIGRPWVYGVAARGENGVRSIIESMKQELRVTMALLGVNRVGDLTRDVLEG